MIYCVIMTIVLHAVFSLIHWVPDTVMRWMGNAVGMHGVADHEGGEAGRTIIAAGRSLQHTATGAAPRPTPTGGGNPRGGGGSGGAEVPGSTGTTRNADHAMQSRPSDSGERP